jgi:hypothetical protein
MSAEGPNQPLNWEAISKLADYDDAAISALFGKAGAEMTTEHIASVRGDAMDLAAAAKERKSPEEFLRQSMQESRQVGGEMVRSMSDVELRDMVQKWSGQSLTDEEIASFRMSTLGLDDWLRERAGAQESVATDPSHIAINQSGSVVAQGDTREQALTRAQEEEGRQI